MAKSTGLTPRRNADDDDGHLLCCCEYINSKRERSHLLETLCDCSEVDDAVDRLFKGSVIPSSRSEEIMSVVEDRLRIPWWNGARKVRLDVVLPWFLVPLNMWISSQNFCCLIVAQGAVTPLSVYLVYRFCLRGVRPRTKFFASWSLATTTCMFCIYQHQVIGFARLPKIVSPWENLCLVAFFAGALFSSHVVRRRASLVLNSRKSLDAKYCKVCRGHVPSKDHHCVWLDACVSAANFGPFVAFLICVSASLIHGGLLFLTSACDSVSDVVIVVLVPTDCWTFNQRFDGDAGLTFAAGVHCICISVLVMMLLLQKLNVACAVHFGWRGSY